jgi:translation initiation factor 3 subunit E
MATYDLTYTIIQSLDRHQVFPLLQFLQEKKLYNAEDLTRAKLELVLKTKMLDTADEEYKALHKTDTVPQAMTDLRNEVYKQLEDWEAACKPLLTIIKERDDNNKLLVEGRRERKEFTMADLAAEGVTEEHLDHLYRYAYLQFEIGQYSPAADYLFYYRLLSSDPDKTLSALWGKLAAEILIRNFEGALDDLIDLDKAINERSVHMSHQKQLQMRTWLIHWSLFVYFNIKDGRLQLVEFMSQPSIMSVIQTNCPHLLRYLVAAVVINHQTNKRERKNNKREIKDTVKVLQAEMSNYRDPVTEFLRLQKNEMDFEAMHQCLTLCKEVTENDFFLSPHANEFMESARLMVFECYCKLHQCIDMQELAERLDLGPDDAEEKILQYIQEARVNGKIDSDRNQLVMGPGAAHRDIYQQILDKTKGLSYRSQQLANNVEKKQAALEVGAD